MGRRRFRRGGGGGRRGGTVGNFAGLMGMIFGSIALLICIITYSIALSQLDTAYTSATGYSAQVGLTDVMGIWPMVVFVTFMAVGIGAIGGSAVMQWMKVMRGGWMEVFMAVIMGAVGIVIAVIMNGVIQAQLYALNVTINATTNIANFAGLVSISGIWGMVIFITLMSGGISSLVAAAVGGYRQAKGLL